MLSKIRVASVAATVLVLVLGFSEPAHASPESNPKSPHERVGIAVQGSAGYAPQIPAGQVVPMAYPSGCGLLVMMFSPANYAEGDVITICQGYAQSIQQTALLYRLRWYGWEQLAGASNSISESASLTTLARWRCFGQGTYTYEVDGSGRLVKNGTTYYAAAWDQKRFNC